MAKRSRRVANLVRVATWGLAAAAVLQELRKPAAERTWHGTVAGVVPYDFRVPTLARVQASLWDPEGSLVKPQPFGVGWTLNPGRIAALLRG